MRVVLYAEGAGDMGGGIGMPPKPGALIPIASWGPAHVLVHRAIAAERNVEATFEHGLRMKRGREARGSDLLDRTTVRPLLAWANPAVVPPPDLALILVDADGDRSRAQAIESYLTDVPVTTAVAVAVHELEAWLLADASAVANQLPGMSAPSDVESLEPRQAKLLLASWCKQAAEVTPLHHRIALARSADLDVLRDRSRSFAAFRRALRVP